MEGDRVEAERGCPKKKVDVHARWKQEREAEEKRREGKGREGKRRGEERRAGKRSDVNRNGGGGEEKEDKDPETKTGPESRSSLRSKC